MTTRFRPARMDEEEAWRQNYQYMQDRHPEIAKIAYDFYLQKVNVLFHAISPEQYSQYRKEHASFFCRHIENKKAGRTSMMISTKEQLKNCLSIEKEFYVPTSSLGRNIRNILLGGPDVERWKYIKALRKLEYYYNNRNKNFVCAFMNLYCARRFNKLGFRLGIELNRGVFDEGLMIFHATGIVVNGDAKVGKNCMLHGANVIGNMGNALKAPVIGDNVRLGAGAKVLGDVYIADDVQIGAGAIVLHSCYEKGALLVGIPAKVHTRR